MEDVEKEKVHDEFSQGRILGSRRRGVQSRPNEAIVSDRLKKDPDQEFDAYQKQMKKDMPRIREQKSRFYNAYKSADFSDEQIYERALDEGIVDELD